MKTQTEVFAFNQGSGYSLPGPIAPSAVPEKGNGEGGRACLIDAYVRAGKPVPKWLATDCAVAVQRPRDLPIALETLREQVGPQYAAPTPWAEQLDSRPGDARGDAKVERRRRALELERDIRAARKKARFGGRANREYWDQELQRLSGELEAIREAERRERDRYKRI